MLLNQSNNWRTLRSEDALSYLLPHLSLFGITRTANLTGLDFTGIPVYTSFRPRATTLTVSCGKGITHVDSIVSSIMESIEIDVAESLNRSLYLNCSYAELPHSNRLSVDKLPLLLNSVFSSETRFSWLPCTSVANHTDSVYLPAATIALTHSSLCDPLMTFVWGTNGLASGFSRDDAILSGLYEYIERDSIVSWNNLLTTGVLKEALVDTTTVPFDSTQKLVQLIRAQGFNLYLFDRTSDLGIPVYRAVIHSPYDTTVSFAEGYGCHHLDEIAVNRAITEAAQSRTVIIAGARDDISYQQLRSISSRSLPNDLSSTIALENFVPCANSFSSSREALHDICARLALLNINNVFVYDFPVPCELVSVVRVFVPGLQHYSHRHNVPAARQVEFTPKLHGLREVLYSIRAA